MIYTHVINHGGKGIKKHSRFLDYVAKKAIFAFFISTPKLMLAHSGGTLDTSSIHLL
jgi:hypothetical protein